MIDEEKLKNHIERKCYEIKHLETIYNSRKRDLLAAIEAYKKKGGLNLLTDRANSAKSAFDDCESVRIETKQCCNALGPEYVEIYNRIVWGDEK